MVRYHLRYNPLMNRIIATGLGATAFVIALFINSRDGKSSKTASEGENYQGIVARTRQSSGEPSPDSEVGQIGRRGQILKASGDTELVYDPNLHKDDPKYARELDRQLAIHDARALLQVADPIVQSGTLQVFQVLSNYFGDEVALKQLRSTYCELAAICFYRERMMKAESRLRSETGYPEELIRDSISAEELYVKKTIAFSKARLSMALDFASDSFFESLYNVKVEKSISNPREDRLEPGQSILAADEDSP